MRSIYLGSQGTNTKDTKDTMKFSLEESTLSSKKNFFVSFASFVFVFVIAAPFPRRVPTER
jgi:hypothetical protein